MLQVLTADILLGAFEKSALTGLYPLGAELADPPGLHFWVNSFTEGWSVDSSGDFSVERTGLGHSTVPGFHTPTLRNSYVILETSN